MMIVLSTIFGVWQNLHEVVCVKIKIENPKTLSVRYLRQNLVAAKLQRQAILNQGLISVLFKQVSF